MSEDKTNQTEPTEVRDASGKTELEVLKERAKDLGVQHSPNIGVDALKEKIDAKLNGTKDETQDDQSTAKSEDTGGSVSGTSTQTKEDEAPKESKAQLRLRKRKEASRLVRVRVACMNPNKKEWEGEMFTVSNSIVGTMSKFVPFDKEWHVPVMIYNMMKSRKFQRFVKVKDKHGNVTKRGELAREFAIEELEPLTQKELDDLARKQAMAAGQEG